MDPETCSRGNAHGSEKHGAAAAAQALPPQAEGGSFSVGAVSPREHRCCSVSFCGNKTARKQESDRLVREEWGRQADREKS